MSDTHIKVIGEEYIHINAEELPVGKPVPFNLYIKDKGLEKIFLNKGTIFSDFAKNSLNNRGISDLFIKSDDASLLKHFLIRTEHKHSLFDESSLKDYSHIKDQHYPIDKASLVHGKDINFSIFSMNKLDLQTVIDASEKSPVRIDGKLLSNVDGDLIIRKNDIPLYRDLLSSLMTDKDVTEHDRARTERVFLKETSKIIIKDLFDKPDSRNNLKAAKRIVPTIIECLSMDTHAIYDLLSIKSYDHYTYTHTLNVAILSIGLGLTINMNNDDIDKLGIGALLHDIGKTAVPLDILNKTGRLLSGEYLIYKNHVAAGENILRGHAGISPESLAVVKQHHEKLSGKGYLSKLKGDEISTFGRIVGITDCYDALTTPGLFRPSLIPYNALLLISKEKKDYDQQILQEFIGMLSHITQDNEISI